MCTRHMDEKLRGRFHTHLVTFLPGLRFAMLATPSLHQPSIVRAEKLIEL